MWFITKKKHEMVVEKLEEEIFDLEIKSNKDARTLKTHLEIQNKKVIECKLELKKRPKFECSDTMLMQKKIEALQRVMCNMDELLQKEKAKNSGGELCTYSHSVRDPINDNFFEQKYEAWKQLSKEMFYNYKPTS